MRLHAFKKKERQTFQCKLLAAHRTVEVRMSLSANRSSGNASVFSAGELRFKSRSVKSDAALLPTASHRCDISSTGAVLPRRYDWASSTHLLIFICPSYRQYVRKKEAYHKVKDSTKTRSSNNTKR